VASKSNPINKTGKQKPRNTAPFTEAAFLGVIFGGVAKLGGEQRRPPYFLQIPDLSWLLPATT
jgi:hypothetical protein